MKIIQTNKGHLLQVLSIIMLLNMFVAGCYYDNEEQLYPSNTTDCSKVSGTFTNVKSLVAGKCATAGCHNAAGAAGNTILETYDQIRSSASRINQRVIIEKTMPPTAPLSAAEIALLKCWISSGTPNN
ncbi:hypothetical protein [Chitinophaga sp. CF418]|uniref:hypothetical protein n=1 Tax=Chitinophaga sp. CF418 TaxID=1855287 RepID=UPI00091377F6|nr:hypothetical protein [Chitinophaga sp. CF418]SHN03092.1 hypothetical protein SAMN05216311_104409 [Chitinophaga sp. CF418]